MLAEWFGRWQRGSVSRGAMAESVGSKCHTPEREKKKKREREREREEKTLYSKVPLLLVFPLLSSFKGASECVIFSKRYVLILGLLPTIKMAASLYFNGIQVSSALESMNEISRNKSNGLFTRDNFTEALGVLCCRNKLPLLESLSKLEQRGM